VILYLPHLSPPSLLIGFCDILPDNTNFPWCKYSYNFFLRIRQDATASLILLWKVTTIGFKQCSLIDGRSVTLLQALGGLVLSEEMLALGNNYFIGE